MWKKHDVLYISTHIYRITIYLSIHIPIQYVYIYIHCIYCKAEVVVTLKGLPHDIEMGFCGTDGDKLIMRYTSNDF
jgi:hypothetical protein